MTLVFYLEKGHCMIETGGYSHNKKATLTVVLLFILCFSFSSFNICFGCSKEPSHGDGALEN